MYLILSICKNNKLKLQLLSKAKLGKEMESRCWEGQLKKYGT